MPVLLWQVDVDMQTRLTSGRGAGFYCCLLAYCLFTVARTRMLEYRRGA